MKMLVGYTGFVGSNLCADEHYDYLVNSSNIEDAYGKAPDLLVYCGVPSEMFTANANPRKDKAVCDGAFENIKKINPRCVVLISTVAVYDDTVGGDEDRDIDISSLAPYGRHRLELERKVEESFDEHLIIRLPAIYGKNLKKNFIYDYINYIPGLLRTDKYTELSSQSPAIARSYVDRGDGFYKVKELTDEDRSKLKKEFERVGFSALNFSDSRSVYQFFSLAHLSNAIDSCLEKGIRKINLVTPPVSCAEVYRYLTGDGFLNELRKPYFNYDLRTKHTQSGYIMTKEQELEEIKQFTQSFL